MFECPTTWTLDKDSKLSKSIKLGVSKAEVFNVTLFFIKKGSFTINPVSGIFTITLRVYNSPVSEPAKRDYTPPVFEVTFKRNTKSSDDKEDVSFSITNLGDFTDKEALKQLVRFENSAETYDFSTEKNDNIFKQIQECVRQKLKEVYTKLQKLLELCVSLTQTLSKEGISTIQCTANTDQEDIKKFLHDMFTSNSNSNSNSSIISSNSSIIAANLTRLRILAGNIVSLLGKTQFFTPLDNNYFHNLNVALKVFGDVYRQITCDTQAQNGTTCYVEEQRIYS